jgi:hypothetical protein
MSTGEVPGVIVDDTVLPAVFDGVVPSLLYVAILPGTSKRKKVRLLSPPEEGEAFSQ